MMEQIERGAKAALQILSGSIIAQVALVITGIVVLGTGWVPLGVAVSWAVYAILGNSAMWWVTRMLDNIWQSDTPDHVRGWIVGQPIAYAIYRGLILVAFGLVNAAALIAAGSFTAE